MRTYNPEQPLFHTHVPKTGGTSFRRVLDEIFGERVNPKNSWVFDPQYPWHPTHVYSSHWDRGAKPVRWPVEMPQFVTFLRDPFEQTLSLYYYTRKYANDLLYVHGPQRPIQDFGKTAEEFVRNNPLDFMLYLPDGDYPQKLDTFVFVGIMERYQECVSAFCRIVGHPPVELPHLLKTPRWDLPDLSLRKWHQAHNPELYELYDYAVETWEPVWRAA